MYSMPGKIVVPKIATIDVVASEHITMSFNDVSYNGSIIHCEFEDKADDVEHTLSFSSPIDNVYIENLQVTHMVVDNKLHFTTPIYKWLFSVIDTK